ncbi:hypothetical protein VIGAN_04039400, partial [Vigna angularis var. angularis]
FYRDKFGGTPIENCSHSVNKLQIVLFPKQPHFSFYNCETLVQILLQPKKKILIEKINVLNILEIYKKSNTTTNSKIFKIL